jgi:hypothetical protein
VIIDNSTIISQAGRRITLSEISDPIEKIMVLIYIKLFPENSLSAETALFTLSIVFPEWLSLCRSIGNHAVL